LKKKKSTTEISESFNLNLKELDLKHGKGKENSFVLSNNLSKILKNT